MGVVKCKFYAYHRVETFSNNSGKMLSCWFARQLIEVFHAFVCCFVSHYLRSAVSQALARRVDKLSVVLKFLNLNMLKAAAATKVLQFIYEEMNVAKWCVFVGLYPQRTLGVCTKRKRTTNIVEISVLHFIHTILSCVFFFVVRSTVKRVLPTTECQPETAAKPASIAIER